MSTLHVIGGSARRTAARATLALMLVTPTVARADTFRFAADTSCLAGGATTTTTSTTLLTSRIATRSTTEPTLEPTTSTSTGTVLGSANYREGKCRNGTA